MTRHRAFALQLVVSAALVALIFGLVRSVWYPGPLFALEGGWEGLRLVAVVNLVLGPLLTLLLFKPGKPGLWLDMIVVILLQLGALGYGIWALHDARPVLLVHADDHFAPLHRAALEQWDESGAALEQWGLFGLQRVNVDLPDDPEAFAAVLHTSQSRPGGLHGLFERYESLDEAWQRTLRDAVRIAPYVAREPEWQQRLDALLARLDRAEEELAFFPFIGRGKRAFLVFDRRTRDLIGLLDIPYDPVLAQREVSRLERAGLGVPRR